MGTLTKIFVIVNLVFSGVFVAVSAVVLSQRVHWRKQYETEAKKYVDAEAKWSKEKKDLDETVGDLTEVSGKQRAEVKRMSDLLVKTESRVKDKEAALGKSESREESLRKEREAFKTDLETERGKIAAAEDRARQAREATRKVQGKVDVCKAELVSKDARIQALIMQHKDLVDNIRVLTDETKEYQKFREVVRAVDPTVHDQAMGMVTGKGIGSGPPSPLFAAVKAVDMGIGVVVLNVGSRSTPPVKEGYKFLIHRRGDFVAAVRVTTVDADMCAAEIIPPKPRSAVEVGDRAVTKN